VGIGSLLLGFTDFSKGYAGDAVSIFAGILVIYASVRETISRHYLHKAEKMWDAIENMIQAWDPTYSKLGPDWLKEQRLKETNRSE